MKWFKHDSMANCDAKLKRLRLKYGMEAYGLYWYCLELISMNVSQHNLTFELEHDALVIAHDTGISEELVTDMMKFMVSLGLFESDAGRITCLKMASKLDEYACKFAKTLTTCRDNVPRLSGEDPERVGRKSFIEQNRTEKKRKEGGVGETRTTVPTGRQAMPTGRQARQIPPDWQPNERTVGWLASEGCNVDDISRLVVMFKNYWLETKSKRSNWDLVFQRNPVVKSELVKLRGAKKKNNSVFAGVLIAK